MGNAVVLGRPVAARVAVEAARALNHLAHFVEQRDRSRATIGNGIKRTGCKKIDLGRRRRRDRHAYRHTNQDNCGHGPKGELAVHASTPLVKGSVLTLLPVSARQALATAGASAGTPGSPTPVGSAADLMIDTSISGISLILSGR